MVALFLQSWGVDCILTGYITSLKMAFDQRIRMTHSVLPVQSSVAKGKIPTETY